MMYNDEATEVIKAAITKQVKRKAILALDPLIAEVIMSTARADMYLTGKADPDEDVMDQIEQQNAALLRFIGIDPVEVISKLISVCTGDYTPDRISTQEMPFFLTDHNGEPCRVTLYDPLFRMPERLKWFMRDGKPWIANGSRVEHEPYEMQPGHLFVDYFETQLVVGMTVSAFVDVFLKHPEFDRP